MTDEKCIEELDRILESGNISWTGEDIRKHLLKAGYVVVPLKSAPGWDGYSQFDGPPAA